MSSVQLVLSFVQAGLTAAACCMIRMDARRSPDICRGVHGCAQWTLAATLQLQDQMEEAADQWVIYCF